MTKEQPLWHGMYFYECYTEIGRMVGYVGLTYREFAAKLQTLIEEYGRRAESVSWHVVTFEGQMSLKPQPLAWVLTAKWNRRPW